MSARLASALTARLLPRLLSRLLVLDRRVVQLLLGALLLVVALECWLLVLRGPLTEWRSLVRQREVSAAAVPAGALRAETERHRHAVEQAERALREADLPHADEEMVLHLVATLAPLAQRHGIQLGQIKAAGRRLERDVQVVSFEGEARGSYLALTGWLAEVEPQIAPLRASELQISSSGEESAVSMRVKFSAYLPGADAPGVPK